VPGPGGKAGARRPITHKRHEKGQQVTSTLSPGTTLAAVEAMRSQDTFTRDQVAYLVHLAYTSGLATGHTRQVVELLDTWAERPATPLPDRAARIAAEVAAAGPPRFLGGLPKPSDSYPAEPGPRPRFPTLAEQSTWLTAEDIAFCRAHAAREGA
jgi:hypothetical protein